MMKAFQVKELTHPSKIKVSEVEIPIADGDKGQVLVEVHASGLNFFDILQSQGKYQTKPPLPFILGSEFSGVISSNSPIPEGCPYQHGDRVFGYAQGTFAEYTIANYTNLIPIPDNLTFEQAATVPLTYTTSYEALVGRAKVKPDEWVLVLAAAGGVGLAACQIAKVLGCKVIAAASSEEKRKVCLDLGGVDAVVDYTKKDWQKQVMSISGGGVNVVFDPVGMIIPSLKCVAWNARLLVVGFAAGTIENIPANLLLLKSVAVLGVYWGGMTTKDIPGVIRTIQSVLKLLSTNKVKPILYPTEYHGIESVINGLNDIENRKVYGKAVVRIRDNDQVIEPKAKAKL